ncbi:unnamed protein product [Trichobilharzia szidati]|nr:unnamed protein product [Trichobilharzia szidati]
MNHNHTYPLPANVKSTHHATYIHPRLMPGYRGHCPGEKFDYGQTYGAYTCKQFQDYRSTVLQSSMTPYEDGGNFPTFLSHNPDLVINKRIQGRQRYGDRFYCQLYNKDDQRSNELRQFDLAVQKHREYYKDKTGTKAPVTDFLIPTTNMEFIKEKCLP